MSAVQGVGVVPEQGQVWIGKAWAVEGRTIRITRADGGRVQYQVLAGSSRRKRSHQRARGMYSYSLVTSYRLATAEEARKAEAELTGRPPLRVDMTGALPGLSCAEVLTDAGVIRVSTGLESTEGHCPAVVIEVERNYADGGRVSTLPAGTWDVRVTERRAAACTYVTLVRRP